jgi:hypothetical protein
MYLPSVTIPEGCEVARVLIGVASWESEVRGIHWDLKQDLSSLCL